MNYSTVLLWRSIGIVDGFKDYYYYYFGGNKKEVQEGLLAWYHDLLQTRLRESQVPVSIRQWRPGAKLRDVSFFGVVLIELFCDINKQVPDHSTLVLKS